MNSDVTVVVFTQKSHGLDSEDDKRKEDSSATGICTCSHDCMYIEQLFLYHWRIIAGMKDLQMEEKKPPAAESCNKCNYPFGIILRRKVNI